MYPCCWRPDRDKYETLLKNHYPWTDDDAAIDREWGATTLYNTFRNPLAHSLGMVDTVKKRGVVVRVPRTGGVGIGKGSLTEKQIETLERSRGRPASVGDAREHWRIGHVTSCNVVLGLPSDG